MREVPSSKARPEVKNGASAPDAAVRRKVRLLLSVATGLFSNGQSSREIIRINHLLSRALDQPAILHMRWGELLLEADAPDGSNVIRTSQAMPASVNMSVVVALTNACTEAGKGRLEIEEAERLLVIEGGEPAPLLLFVGACIAGACALSITIGGVHLPALGCITLSAGFGGFFRRYLGHLGLSNVVQVFAAALLAGAVGCLAVHFRIDGGLRLIAICPCMILVPGPHLINGCLELFALRIPLGISRIAYAGLIILGICAGLLLGLSFGKDSLLVQSPANYDTFWADVAAAGLAAGCYGIYFSMPLRMLMWPVLTGMVAHAIHWKAIADFDAGPASSAALAGIAAGLALLPLSRRLKLPFAAVGFASVVSLIPGTFIFRFCSGIVQIEAHAAGTATTMIAGTLADAVAAVMVLLAIVLGLSLPAHLLDHLRERKSWPN